MKQLMLATGFLISLSGAVFAAAGGGGPASGTGGGSGSSACSVSQYNSTTCTDGESCKIHEDIRVSINTSLAGVASTQETPLIGNAFYQFIVTQLPSMGLLSRRLSADGRQGVIYKNELVSALLAASSPAIDQTDVGSCAPCQSANAFNSGAAVTTLYTAVFNTASLRSSLEGIVNSLFVESTRDPFTGLMITVPVSQLSFEQFSVNLCNAVTPPLPGGSPACGINFTSATGAHSLRPPVTNLTPLINSLTVIYQNVAANPTDYILCYPIL